MIDWNRLIDLLIDWNWFIYWLIDWLIDEGVGVDGKCIDDCKADLSSFYGETGQEKDEKCFYLYDGKMSKDISLDNIWK